MQPPQTWRELLENHLSDPEERQRLADAIGVNAITLVRWANNSESSPRPKSLLRLLAALPQQHELLLHLIEEEFKDFSSFMSEGTPHACPPTIPTELYIRVLYTLSTIPKNLLFSSLGDLILQQALNQLDPQRLGMAITVACCIPPPLHANKVQSLRARMGRGTPPWNTSSEQQAVLLGAESLAGQAIISARMKSNPQLRDSGRTAPGYSGMGEESAVAAPIMRIGNIVGSLLVSSTRAEYFTEQKCILIRQYAELLSLIFDHSDFYPLTQIELRIMPPLAVQYPYLITFRDRLMQTMLQAQRNQQQMTIMQAEQVVWQQIEQELFQQAFNSV